MITYPLNNIEYTAEDAELFHSTRTSGVYSTGSFEYSITGRDNSITIEPGIAWIKNGEFSGKVVAQKEPMSLDVGLSDQIYPRIDSVVIQFNANKNSTEIVVKHGVASSIPTPPEVIRKESIYELHLYHITRNAGTVSISSSNITDLRTNDSFCGLMSDSVTQAVDITLSKSGVAADSKTVGLELGRKAPDGHGLGKKSSEMKIYSTPEELDDLKAAGWYSYYNETAYACGYAGTQYGGILVIPAMYGYTQFFFCRSHYEAYLKRHYDSSSGLWGVWEWVNPPMKEGVEYRTTERYNGNPVYTKLVDCGNLPNTESKRVGHGASDVKNVIRITGTTSTGHSIPYYYTDGEILMYANSTGIWITTTFDASARTAVAQIWYIKTDG